jgi:hypothetical protein
VDNFIFLDPKNHDEEGTHDLDPAAPAAVEDEDIPF